MKKKLSDVKHGRRNFGLFFLLFPTLSLVLGLLDGKFEKALKDVFVPYDVSIPALFGQYLFIIIGVYLLIIDGKKEIKKTTIIYYLSVFIILLMISILFSL